MNSTIDLIAQRISEAIFFTVKFLKAAWEQPNAPELLGIALAAFILLIILRKIKNYRKPIKLFDNRVGVVEVSRKALDELVQSVCYSLGALNRPDVDIYTRRGRLCMSVSLKLESGQKLTDATAEIQSALTSAFREHLGVEKLGRIDVRVLGFKGLIYKPTTKFLPPAPEIDDEEDDDVLFSEKNPVINSVDDSKREPESKS